MAHGGTDLSTAFDIYATMQRHGVEPDDLTYGHLIALAGRVRRLEVRALHAAGAAAAASSRSLLQQRRMLRPLPAAPLDPALRFRALVAAATYAATAAAPTAAVAGCV